MKETKIKMVRKARRLKRVRKKLLETKGRFRLSVFRSNKYIYAQVIDDSKGVTVVTASEKSVKEGKPMDKAREVGQTIAKAAIAKKVKDVVFDKGSYKYHGKVKVLAEAAREGGLNF